MMHFAREYHEKFLYRNLPQLWYFKEL